MLDPLADEAQAKAAGTSPAAARRRPGCCSAGEVGGVVGLMARRVLGQYELPLLDPEAPGAAAARRARTCRRGRASCEVDRGELLTLGRAARGHPRRAVRARVPWLRAHLGGLLRELIGALDVKLDPRALAAAADAATTCARGRSGCARAGCVGAVVGPERRALLDRIQATMALVEGHAEHVMDARRRATCCPTSTGCARRWTAAARERPPLLRLLERLLGLEMKMRQYEGGKRFCDAVVEPGGDRRRSTAPGRRPRRCRRWPSSRTRRLAARTACRARPPASPVLTRGVTGSYRPGLQTCVRWYTRVAT